MSSFRENQMSCFATGVVIATLFLLLSFVLFMPNIFRWTRLLNVVFFSSNTYPPPSTMCLFFSSKEEEEQEKRRDKKEKEDSSTTISL